MITGLERKLARSLAKSYVEFLDQDNGVYSKSHYVMHEHCKYFGSDDAKDLYHAEIAKIFEARNHG